MKWYPGQPNQDNFLDYCLAVRKSKDDVGFKNVGHYVDMRHYICERNVYPVTTTQVPIQNREEELDGVVKSAKKVFNNLLNKLSFDV